MTTRGSLAQEMRQGSLNIQNPAEAVSSLPSAPCKIVPSLPEFGRWGWEGTIARRVLHRVLGQLVSVTPS